MDFDDERRQSIAWARVFFIGRRIVKTIGSAPISARKRDRLGRAEIIEINIGLLIRGENCLCIRLIVPFDESDRLRCRTFDKGSDSSMRTDLCEVRSFEWEDG